MMLERTHYFAKPGLAAQVLACRRRACAVRLSLGLAAGQVFVGDDPDVVWECAFADAAEQQADLAARAASPEFEAVRATMRGLITRFERHILTRTDTGLPSFMRATDLAGHPIAPEPVAFESAGHRLHGWLHLPPGEGPFPCIITNHGSGIDRGTEDTARPGTAALLMSWGIASFLPHRRGYGASTGPAWREEASEPPGTDAYDRQLSGRLDRESDDILAALDAIAARPDIRPDHIGVMGSSFGGATTLLAASKTNRFTCAIDFAGAAMNWDRAPLLRETLLAAAARLTMPIFLIQAANDYSVRPTLELGAALAAMGKIAQAKIYPAFGVNHHEGHLLESRGPTIWAKDVHQFLERHL